MAVVIGAGTTVTFDRGDCVVSANWGINPNTQRLYCLGSFEPYQSYNKPTETLNLTIYSPGVAYDVTASTSCVTPDPIVATITPGACGNTVTGPTSTTWQLSSYSFSKDDPLLPGQESWAMQQWVEGADGTPIPDYVIRGIAEGSGSTVGGVPNCGIVFVGDTTESSSGSVSAGQIGRADTIRLGVVSTVGGGSTVQGETGTGNVSIPLTPLWL